MADAASPLVDSLEALGIGGGLGDMLAEARRALAAAESGPSPEVVALAQRLEVVTQNLEMTLELWARLVPAWNIMADNVNTLTEAMATPLARMKLNLARVPKV